MSTDTTKPVVSPAARRSLKSSSGAVSTPLSVTLGRYSAIILWAGFTILFGILRPDTFLSSVTWRLTFSEGVVTAIVALAFLVPLAAGVYDLSVGATMGTGLVLMNWFGLNPPGPPPWQVAIGVLVAAVQLEFGLGHNGSGEQHRSCGEQFFHEILPLDVQPEPDPAKGCSNGLQFWGTGLQCPPQIRQPANYPVAGNQATAAAWPVLLHRPFNAPGASAISGSRFLPQSRAGAHGT